MIRATIGQIVHALGARINRHEVYRANPKVLRSPNFCVGCFELIISKNFAAACKMGKDGQKKIFCIFFFAEPIFA